MRKIFSILLTCALLLSLLSVVSFAESEQRSIPLLGVVVDGATETQEFPADGMGGVSLAGTGGWKAWVSYYTDGVAEFAPKGDEKLYLVYDMTVPSGTNVQFTINGWNEPISKELAGDAAELGEGGVYSIPAGTYSGALELNPSQIGENGRIGILGNGIEIRTCALVCTAGTPETPEPYVPAPTEPKPTEIRTLEESASLDLIGTISNGSDETDETEIKDNGNGFVISQTKTWNVWVLNYVEEAADFDAAEGEELFLAYDLTVNGDGHLCINGWDNSVAAAIAAEANAKTSSAENGTPMLKAGTYTGSIPVTKDMIGENGRLGIVGTGATIREFRLVSAKATVSTVTGNVQPTAKPTSAPTKKDEPVVTDGVDLIDTIMNGTNEADETEIKDNGNGFVITQASGWNVWVLYYTEEAAEFDAAEGEALYLSYDFTLNGDAHLCLNGWENSVAGAIASASGVATTPAEDGTPMLTAGTYTGMLAIDKSGIGENGRLGIVGTGATIRSFKLVSAGRAVPAETEPAPTETEPTVTETEPAVTEAEPTATTPQPIVTETAPLATETQKAPETSPKEEPTGQTVIQLGDPTDDGLINMKDVLALRKYIAGIPVQINLIAADVNNDGAINMKDVLMLRKYIAGIITSLDIVIVDPTQSEPEPTDIPAEDGSYTVTVSLGTADKLTAKAGETVTITADTPADGLAFDKWVGDGIIFADSAAFTTQFVMPNKDITIEATYKMLVGPTDPTEEDPTAPTKGETVTGELNLIDLITNGSAEVEEGTEITDNGNGFVISQTAPWNVWVLYFNEDVQNFAAGEGEEIYLEYDMTLNGDGHLCVNEWQNSIAADIAAAAGASTTFAEDGTPMLIQGTYKGRIKVSPSLFGETGRLGIVGNGATIRTFKLVSVGSGEQPTSATTKKTDGTDETIPTKTTPPTQAGEPYITYNTAEKFGSLGVWWWNANQISNASQRKQRLDFLQQNHVTEIYLCITTQDFADIKDFVKDAGSRGMRVAWLSGDASWIESGNTGFDGVFAKFKAYQEQATASEKFYGLHFDVEPQAGGGSINWQGYADLVLRATKAAHDYGTLIEWDIPFWLDGTTVNAGGKSVRLLNLLAENSDTLTLMSYRDTAAAVLDISSQEIPLSAQYGCRIILGLESNYTAEGANLSFAEDGRTALCNVADSILTSLSTKEMTGGYGVAIHYVDTFMNLRP